MDLTPGNISKYLYEEECRQIIGACYEVHNYLGSGFLEPIYQEALALELTNQNIPFYQEKRLEVWYKDEKLQKFYIADFVCFDKIILELKAVDGIVNEHVGQVLNYLKATQFKLGLFYKNVHICKNIYTQCLNGPYFTRYYLNCNIKMPL
ncbi:MAG: GxxExxY protein [Bacteroidetes bacterium CG_4_9_14_3_um_filter_41_19]|nr:MAG: GxxExxY protein [Bacteroidetes bacterium CG_4_9_14_3_um_filter_41_19]